MTTQMVIRLDEHQREKLNQLSRAEGKATSQVVRELIDTFIKEHDIGGYIDDLWSRIGHTLSKNGYTVDDIPRMIRESRKASQSSTIASGGSLIERQCRENKEAR